MIPTVQEDIILPWRRCLACMRYEFDLLVLVLHDSFFKPNSSQYDAIDLRTQRHLDRVLAALREQRVGPSELSGGLDGYAHGDLGREAIDGKVLVYSCMIYTSDDAREYSCDASL